MGAVKKGDRLFLVSLLACGWPPQKNYKWQDVGKLVRYGETTFEKREIVREPFSFSPVPVENGTAKAAELSMEAPGTEPLVLLMGEGEPVTVRTKLPKSLEAPFPAGLVVGQVDYYVNGDAGGKSSGKDGGRSFPPYSYGLRQAGLGVLFDDALPKF